MGWGLFDELEVDYDNVADSREFWMSMNNLNQLLSRIWLVEGVSNGVIVVILNERG